MTSPTIMLEASLGIGDVIAFAPMVRRLKREYPKASITVLSRRAGFLAKKQLAGITRILTPRTPRDYLALLTTPVDILFMPGYYQSTNGILNTIAYRALFKAIPARQRFTLGDLDSQAHRDLNRVDVYLRLLHQGGLETSPNDRCLFVPFAIDQTASPLPGLLEKSGHKGKRVAVVHIGSKAGYTTRDWPSARWQTVLEHVWRQYGLVPILIGTQDDRQRNAEVANRLRTPYIDQTEKLSLEATSTLIRDANVFISTNSGPMWLAAAMEKPQLALCGPSKTAWDPLNPNAIVLREQPDRKKCRPPCDARTCAYRDNQCMLDITEEDAIAALDRVVSKHLDVQSTKARYRLRH